MNEGGTETPLRAFFDSTFKGGANPNDWMNIIHAPTSGFGLRSSDGPARRPSADQRAFYRENGYLLAREIVPLMLLDELRLRLRRLDSGSGPEEDGGDTERLATADAASLVLRDVLSQFVRVPTLLDWVEDFCGSDILSLGAMLVRVAPEARGNGSGARLHQNGHFVPLECDESKVVSVWAPLEGGGTGRTVVDALAVLPGTHRGPLLPHDHHAHEQGRSLVSDVPGGITPVALGAEPGDVVFLHPRLLHGSRPNRGSTERTELVAHFAAAGAPFVQRPHINQEYWKQNAQLVRGISSRL